MAKLQRKHFFGTNMKLGKKLAKKQNVISAVGMHKKAMIRHKY